MAKAEAKVEELVGMVERGELRLPEMQRQYVWRAPRVRDLLDSLYRGYPSGAILLWETDEDVPLRDMSVTQSANPYQTARLLLDGQQRLTSLSAVLRGGGVTVQGRKRPIDILFNLEHPDKVASADEVNEGDDGETPGADEIDASEDELTRRFEQKTFVVATARLAALPQWVKVSDVLRGDPDALILKRAGVTGFDDPRYEKYTARLAQLRGIRNYQYRMDILERTLSYEEVTEIFVRVNSLGAKLRSSDLALAQITARWRHSLVVFQQFQEECTKSGFNLDLGIYLKALIAFATGQSRFTTVGSLSLQKLQDGWASAMEGMRFAINFLRNNVGIDSPALMSSPFLMIALGYYGHVKNYHLTDQEAADLRRWALLANAKGRYSRGSSETLLDQDLTTITQSPSGEALIDRVRRQFGRLEIVADDLEGKDQRSSLFKTMFLAFRAAGARDWTSNLQIALGHSGVGHRIEFHHFFPKAQLGKTGRSVREADDIANLAFISAKTNRQLGDKLPAAYLTDPGAPSAEQLAAQSIPADPELWGIDQYSGFLSNRRRLIADALNRFITQGRIEHSPILDVAALIAGKETEEVEFKSSLRWDVKLQQVNKVLEQVILKSIAALSNAKGGTLLIGVRDDGEPLGLKPDYDSLGGDRDTFERHVRGLINSAWGVSLGADAVKLSFPEVHGIEICAIEVRAGHQPLFNIEAADKFGHKAEKLYIRSGSMSVPVDSTVQAAAYINRRFPGYARGTPG